MKNFQSGELPVNYSDSDSDINYSLKGHFCFRDVGPSELGNIGIQKDKCPAYHDVQDCNRLLDASLEQYLTLASGQEQPTPTSSFNFCLNLILQEQLFPSYYHYMEFTATSHS